MVVAAVTVPRSVNTWLSAAALSRLLDTSIALVAPGKRTLRKSEVVGAAAESEEMEATDGKTRYCKELQEVANDDMEVEP